MRKRREKFEYKNYKKIKMFLKINKKKYNKIK
jgi:hypothetical protein